MPNILLSTTFTPQELTLAETRAIASPAYAEIEFTITNRVFADLNNLQFAMRIGQWVSATYTEAGGFPSNGFYEYVPNTPTATTWYDCNWVGNANARIGKLQIYFDNGAGSDCKVRLRLYFIAGFDINNTFKNAFYDNQDHLLKDAQASISILNNNASTNDVYNVEKRFCFSVWVRDVTDNSTSKQAYKIANLLRFYNSGLNGFGPDYLYQTGSQIILERPLATPVTNLSNQANTIVRLQYSELSALASCTNWHLNCQIFVYLIEINGTDASKTFIQNYNLQYVDVQSGGTPLDTNYEIGNNGVLIGPFTALTPLGGGDYECSFYVKASLINPNKKYRFISVVRVLGTCLPAPTYDTGLIRFHDFSFISPEYLSQDASECLPIPDLVFDENSISDYNKKYTSALRVCAGERLRSHIKVNFSNYDLDSNRAFQIASPFPNGVTYIRVRTYIESGAKKHLYSEELIQRTPSGFTAKPNISVAIVGHSVEVIFDYRTRYESWLKNYATEQNGVNFPPEITMNWIGKTIFIEFIIYLNNLNTITNQAIVDIVTVRQKVLVRDFDIEGENGSLSTQFTKLNGDSINYICTTDNKIKVCVKANNGANGTENFIAMLENAPFGINYLQEEESYNSNSGLNKSQNDVLESVDPLFNNATDTACAVIDTSSFIVGEKKYLLVYKKRNL